MFPLMDFFMLVIVILGIIFAQYSNYNYYSQLIIYLLSTHYNLCFAAILT